VRTRRSDTPLGDVTDARSALHCDPQLADYLTIIGFLHKHGDRYELAADAKAFLDRESPAYLGGTLSFILAPGLRESFQRRFSRGGISSHFVSKRAMFPVSGPPRC
jgi:hypothetical protein